MTANTNTITVAAPADLAELAALTTEVLRDPDTKPTGDQLDAAARIGTAVVDDKIGLDPTELDDILPGLLACAGVVFREALLGLSLVRAPLEHLLARVVRRRWNVPIGTAAVALDPKNGRTTLFVNPFFALALGPVQMRFVLAHESRHLLFGHLMVDRDLSKDELFTLASEILINHRTKKDLNAEIPRVNGETVGIDPEREYLRYRERAKAAGLTPVGRDVFFATDEDCWRALSALPKQPACAGSACAHAAGAAGSSKGSGKAKAKGSGPEAPAPAPTPPGDEPGGDTDSGAEPATGLFEELGPLGGLGHLDDPTVDHSVEEVLHQAVKEALAGNTNLRDALLELGEEFPGSPTWGRVSLGALRGEKPRSTVQSHWEQFLSRALASRTTPSDRLEYNRKIGWWYPFFTPTGRDQEWEVAVFYDASGSISGPLVERCSALIGSVPNARVSWFSFDHDVYELGVTEDGAGSVSPIQGGGGTSFLPIYEKVAELDEEPDVVIVVTDGYVSPSEQVEMAESGKYCFLVTPGGHAWMADLGIETIVVDDELVPTR